MNGETFARYFDSQYELFDDDLPLWIELARSSAGHVLELGCGTGRVLRALAANDIPVIGIDWDPAMLQRAGNNLFPRFQSSVQLSNQDIREFSLGESFSLILAICNVIAQLPLPQARKVFERALTHLQPGGLLAIDLG